MTENKVFRNLSGFHFIKILHTFVVKENVEFDFIGAIVKVTIPLASVTNFFTSGVAL
jgi:hypothetical protein